jgi:hypothetical protein
LSPLSDLLRFESSKERYPFARLGTGKIKSAGKLTKNEPNHASVIARKSYECFSNRTKLGALSDLDSAQFDHPRMLTTMRPQSMLPKPNVQTVI